MRHRPPFQPQGRNQFKMLPISQRRLRRAERAGIDITDRSAIERFEASLPRDGFYEREK